MTRKVHLGTSCSFLGGTISESGTAKVLATPEGLGWNGTSLCRNQAPSSMLTMKGLQEAEMASTTGCILICKYQGCRRNTPAF